METGGIPMVTILCSGSRGDVQPYIALAQALGKLGIAARIAVNKDFEGFVRAYGVDVFPIDIDFESIKVDPAMIKEAQKADNPLKMLFSFRKMREYGVHMVDKYHAACESSDAIVYHPGLSIGFFMAEKLGIPSVLASPFPLHRTALRPSVLIYGKAASNPLLNRVSYDMLQGMLWMASESALRPFWKKTYGKLPARFGKPFERHADARHPVIVSCSDYVFSRPEDWSDHIHQAGYWFVEEPTEYIPPPELAAFISNGEKPVYVGFGSMFDRDDAEKIAKEVIEGLALAGKRGVINGMGGLKDLPDSVMAVDGVPHSWLFPRMAAVCHHGGAGTSAAGFRAGVPSVILPFALDQFAWAQRSYELGVGSKPLPAKNLNAEKLAQALNEAAKDAVIERARELGRNIAEENGARAGARIIADALASPAL
jgi:sterol 3beta-glucosyltransferase